MKTRFPAGSPRPVPAPDRLWTRARLSLVAAGRTFGPAVFVAVLLLGAAVPAIASSPPVVLPAQPTVESTGGSDSTPVAVTVKSAVAGKATFVARDIPRVSTDPDNPDARPLHGAAVIPAGAVTIAPGQ